MTEPELLETREEIKRVLIEYAHAQDTKDWEKLASLLTVDVCGDYGGSALEPAPGREIVHGRDALIAQHRKYLGSCGPTQHLLGNFLIDIRGDRAFSRCYVRAMHVGTGYLRTTYYDLWGMYQDELVRARDGWKICHRVERAFHEVGDLSVFAPDDELP